jgi:hypothetical protein
MMRVKSGGRSRGFSARRGIPRSGKKRSRRQRVNRGLVPFFVMLNLKFRAFYRTGRVADFAK